MTASRKTIIQGVIEKISNSIEGYKVISDANLNDDIVSKIRILNNPTPVIINGMTMYEYEISTDENKSLLFNGINIKNMNLNRISNGSIDVVSIKDHIYVDYTRDKIVTLTNSLNIEDELTTSSSTTILIKDISVPPFTTLPMRTNFTPKCFALEFHITSKDDTNGVEADEVIDYLEQILYSDFKRTIDVVIDKSLGKIAYINMHGKLDYYDSIESKLNNIQKRIATAKFYFFVKY